MQAYQYALHGFQVSGLQHVAGHFERVEPLTRREVVSEVAERISFVGIRYGVRKVYGVRSVGTERIE